MNATIGKIFEGLQIVWAIARKDIWDALSNKLVMTLLITVGLMVSIPRLFPLVIEPPYTTVVVYDADDSMLLLALDESDSFRVQRAESIEELEEIIGDFEFGLGPELGLGIPGDFNQILEAGGQSELEGYINWANRKKAAQLQSDFEDRISDMLGAPVHIQLGDHFVYPALTSSLTLGIFTTTSIAVVIIVGILLVPNLIFDEKQTKTMDALLVSPANIGQVVLGKALAGWFYLLLTSIVLFLVNWTGVVHWELAILFTFCSGLFSIAVGLIFGSFFQSQQEVTGWTSAIVLLLLGTILVGMMDLELPTWLQSMIPWVPSVTMSEIFRASFSGSGEIHHFWAKLSSLVGVSSVLYGIVIWKLRRLDR
jgi:ABC-type transport system involved in multi-copper enzyme maturation permease subunit